LNPEAKRREPPALGIVAEQQHADADEQLTERWVAAFAHVGNTDHELAGGTGVLRLVEALVKRVAVVLNAQHDAADDHQNEQNARGRMRQSGRARDQRFPSRGRQAGDTTD
jgi:hypothetical protein